MLLNNPFDRRQVYENDPDGFLMPYKLASKTDLEVMNEKYMRLRKASYGCIVRLGIPEKKR
ncbi:hypothetical protein Glo7428_3146 [Gloeocapsa sp. PCC 7428]|uniref:hypothetical protein n=1 Tax=Gloeocapsa sp. PCC 7428 TaxID=1173026 RepID=UPI0002A5EF28|nr:hypothetical protein [Gloeocapsa sp. PCC 7428]AFZ31633.1 hypothetical protein Glo7428_3146 [Gloeocapsa sp. PCC 7428]